nr:MAG TPA: hypothetical protein [Caudoviricetes sp.]
MLGISLDISHPFYFPYFLGMYLIFSSISLNYWYCGLNRLKTRS